MPLIQVKKSEKEQEYEFTAFEKLALKILPEEQVKAANHVEHLIEAMIDDETRDASPEHTRQSIYAALELKNPQNLLAAAKNLTVAEKNKIVQGLYSSVLCKADSKSITYDDVGKILILEQGSIDLFDLCLKLEERYKR